MEVGGVSNVNVARLSAFCVTLATIPFMAGFFFVDQMLLAVKFDPEASRQTIDVV